MHPNLRLDIDQTLCDKQGKKIFLWEGPAKDSFSLVKISYPGTGSLKNAPIASCIAIVIPGSYRHTPTRTHFLRSCRQSAL